jgi:hypothetical protein
MASAALARLRASPRPGVRSPQWTSTGRLGCARSATALECKQPRQGRAPSRLLRANPVTRIEPRDRKAPGSSRADRLRAGSDIGRPPTCTCPTRTSGVAGRARSAQPTRPPYAGTGSSSGSRGGSGISSGSGSSSGGPSGSSGGRSGGGSGTSAPGSFATNESVPTGCPARDLRANSPHTPMPAHAGPPWEPCTARQALHGAPDGCGGRALPFRAREVGGATAGACAEPGRFSPTDAPAWGPALRVGRCRAASGFRPSVPSPASRRSFSRAMPLPNFQGTLNWLPADPESSRPASSSPA